MVLEAAQHRQTEPPVALSRHRNGDLPHRTRPCALGRRDVEQSEPLVELPLGVREPIADDLEAGTYRKDHRSPLRCLDEPTISRQTLGCQHLWAVFAATDGIEISLRQALRGSGRHELDVEVTPASSGSQHLAVAGIAVGAEQIGVDRADPERTHAEASRRSRNAV